MEGLIFFFLLPLAAGAVQYPLTRSRLPRRAKWAPAALVALVGIICLGGMTELLSLPQTYLLSQNAWIAFPDYYHVGLLCLPALLGLGLGALFAVDMSEQWNGDEKP